MSLQAWTTAGTIKAKLPHLRRSTWGCIGNLRGRHTRVQNNQHQQPKRVEHLSVFFGHRNRSIPNSCHKPQHQHPRGRFHYPPRTSPPIRRTTGTGANLKLRLLVVWLDGQEYDETRSPDLQSGTRGLLTYANAWVVEAGLSPYNRSTVKRSIARTKKMNRLLMFSVLALAPGGLSFLHRYSCEFD